MKYIQRKIESTVLRLLATYKSVTITGPRQCGKTTMLRHLFPDGTYLNIENPNVLAQLTEDPIGTLRNAPKPLILDEIQQLPTLINTLQYLMDEKDDVGQYILTGSFEAKVREGVSKSLVGRTALINMLPLSLSELKSAGIELDANHQMLKGFLPNVYRLEEEETSEYYSNYMALYVQKDVESILRLNNKRSFLQMIQLLAGRVGSLLNYSSLSSDTGVSSTTIKEWISILEACHIIFLLPPWSRSISSQISKSPKIYFFDTGLLCNILGIETLNHLVRDPLRGSIFENMVIMEAYKSMYNAYSSPRISYYRDSKGLEVDLILERQRIPFLYEIKSAETINKEFASSMVKLERKLGNAELKKTVIYAGENISLNNIDFTNFSNVDNLLQQASTAGD